MSSSIASITIAGEREIVELIRCATRRLVVMAPAVTNAVADAIGDRLETIGKDQVAVILDIDPEVYRLGYGDWDGLEQLVRAGTTIRRQPGVRIGLIVSDDQTLVYSPTPRLIEAGPNTQGAANAIHLGAPTSALVRDLDPNAGGVRVGATAMSTEEVDSLRKNLDDNPPQAFNIARRMTVFNSHFEFAELELTGVNIARKRVRIPNHLLAGC